MRGVLYVLIVCLLFFAPVERVEVAKLLPVKAIAVYKTDDMTVVEIDSGDKGTGVDAEEAYQELRMNLSHFLYTDTTEYIFVAEDTKDALTFMQTVVKPNVQIFVCDAAGIVKEMAEYLGVHEPETELHSKRTK